MRRLIKGGRFALHRTFMYLLYDVLRLQRASLIRRLTPIPAKMQSICSVYITLWLMSRRSVVCKLQALYCSFCHGIPIARNFPTLAYIDSGDTFACFYRLFLPTTLPKTRVFYPYVLRNPSIDSIIIGGEERILKTISPPLLIPSAQTTSAIENWSWHPPPKLDHLHYFTDNIIRIPIIIIIMIPIIYWLS